MTERVALPPLVSRSHRAAEVIKHHMDTHTLDAVRLSESDSHGLRNPARFSHTRIRLLTSALQKRGFGLVDCELGFIVIRLSSCEGAPRMKPTDCYKTEHL